VAGDTALLVSTSGNVTVDVASACDDLDCTGYTGTLTLSAGLTCYGNWLTVAGMTFTPGTQTVTFAATSAGKTITTGGKVFYNVTFNGSGGTWTLLDDFSMNRTLALTAGTLNLGGFTLTSSFNNSISMSGFVLDVGAGTFSHVGALIAEGSGRGIYIAGGTLDIAGNFTTQYNAVFTCTGAATIRVGGNLTFSCFNYTIGTSTVYLYGASKTVSASNSFYNLVIGYAANASTRTATADVTVANDLTIVASRTLSMGTYTLAVGGDFDSPGTFTCGTGTVIFNDAAKVSTVSGATTFNVLSITTPDKTVKFTHGQTFTVASFVATGTAGHNVILTSDDGANTFALSDASGTNSASYATISWSAAAGGATWLAYTTNGCVDDGNNSGWVFAAVSSGAFLQLF